MSSINGLGQNVLHYFQNTRINSAHEGIEPIADSDEDGDGNAGDPGDQREELTPFGKALLAALKKHGVNAEQFRIDFLNALHEMMVDQSAEGSAISHLNAVG